MRTFLSGLFLASVILIGSRYLDRFYHVGLEVLFLDVGQGDSILLRFDGDKNYLVDGGGGFKNFSVAEHEIFPELSRLGILTLDGIILSHPDQDHGYGLIYLFQNLNIKNFAYHKVEKPLMDQLIREAMIHKVKVEPLKSNKKFSLSGANIELIPVGSRSLKSNNQALAVTITYNHCAIFLGGDLEKEVEQMLSVGRQTLVKVSHHGSKTSSTDYFVRNTRPKAAVISVGRSNSYGHPNRDVINRWRNIGAQVFRTDYHGFVRFRFFRDETFSCETAHGNCGYGRCSY